MRPPSLGEDGGARVRQDISPHRDVSRDLPSLSRQKRREGKVRTRALFTLEGMSSLLLLCV